MNNKNNLYEIRKFETQFLSGASKDSNGNLVWSATTNRVTDRAKRAYKNYILNFDPDIISDVYNLIKERLEYNKNNITSLLKIENNNITFEEIMEIFNNQRENIANFKKSICTKKLDDKFIYSEYQVPIRNNWNDIKR